MASSPERRQKNPLPDLTPSLKTSLTRFRGIPNALAASVTDGNELITSPVSKFSCSTGVIRKCERRFPKAEGECLLLSMQRPPPYAALLARSHLLLQLAPQLSGGARKLLQLLAAISSSRHAFFLIVRMLIFIIVFEPTARDRHDVHGHGRMVGWRVMCAFLLPALSPRDTTCFLLPGALATTR